MILEEIEEILENFINTFIEDTKGEKTLLKNLNSTDDKSEIKLAKEYMKILKDKIENPNNNLVPKSVIVILSPDNNASSNIEINISKISPDFDLFIPVFSDNLFFITSLFIFNFSQKNIS
jgi:hypothetical protein